MRLVLFLKVNLLNHVVNYENVASLKRYEADALDDDIYKTAEVTHQLLPGVNFPRVVDHLRGYKEVITHQDASSVSFRDITVKLESFCVDKNLICFKVLALGYIEEAIIFLVNYWVESVVFCFYRVVSHEIVIIPILVNIQIILLEESQINPDGSLPQVSCIFKVDTFGHKI